VVGAAAFLAASMQMPLTAVALVMEFTHMDHSYLAPALLCAAGFSLLAILSLYFPELPGNGKGPMQLALSDGLPLSMVAVLLVL
ncbi:chloride channel protein, partial [Klebsiella pneumoniae]|uniref:chloride channel protein n=1 Tax=Klebsiella pneumoniae TaxID=573 RepID=UPI0028F3EB85